MLSRLGLPYLRRDQLARALPWATTLPSIAALAWSAARFYAGADLTSVPVLLVAAIAAELLKLTIYEAKQQTLSFSLSVGIVMAAMTTEPALGPPAAAFVGLIHVLAVRQRAPAKVVFNICNPTLSGAAATLVYLGLRPREPGFEPGHLVAALFAVAAYYVCNTGMVAGMVSIHSGRPLRTVLRDSAWFGPTNILLGLTGAFVGGIQHTLGAMGDAMFLVPVLLMRVTLGFYARRSQQTIKTLESQAEELDFQARHDTLTGLINRTELQSCLDHRIRLGFDRPFALLLIDLDRFKEINDTFGHHYGDLLLQEVGPRLRAHLAPDDVMARLGGDEFGILLRDSDSSCALDVAQRVLQALNEVFVVQTHQLHVGASIGVAMGGEHGRDAATLFRRADVAMYLAKTSHAGVAVYSAEQDGYSPAKLALVGDLRHALQRRELMVYFQPKVNLRTGVADSAEALVRWPHRTRGMIRPDIFIPLAEHTGLIKPLTEFVLDEVLRQLSSWLSQGWDLSVAVNASMQDLHDPTFPDLIVRLLRAHAVPARHLRVEVTEGAVMADIDRTIAVLSRIRELGVGVSVDDFGTGYSSLAYLKRLPIDELKLDRSFVQHLGSDDDDAAIVRATITLGHDMGMSVTAEGAEDEAAVSILARYGCDRIQGYVFSKPLPAGDFITWLQHQASASRLAA